MNRSRGPSAVIRCIVIKNNYFLFLALSGLCSYYIEGQQAGRGVGGLGVGWRGQADTEADMQEKKTNYSRVQAEIGSCLKVQRRGEGDEEAEAEYSWPGNLFCFSPFQKLPLQTIRNLREQRWLPCLVMTVASNQGVLSEMLCSLRGNKKIIMLSA